jgi:hypothetical protein
MDIHHSAITVIALVGLAVTIPRSAIAQSSAMPETVMVTYHAKAGSEAALANAIARQWAAANRLKLVLETPHTLVRGDEQGRPTSSKSSPGETPIFPMPRQQPYKISGQK